MGDEQVPLADVDTTNPTVIQRYGEWIEAFVKEYKIDGLRIDGKRRSTPPTQSVAYISRSSRKVCVPLR
jgi:uncharacterized lipoprotein YddW (UPF0748 family)